VAFSGSKKTSQDDWQTQAMNGLAWLAKIVFKKLL
jgi:hypothetical protein